MSARDRPGRSDPDDWFADLDEAAPASRPRATPPTLEHQLQRRQFRDTDEWLNVQTGPGEAPASASGFTITLGALLSVAAVALAVVVLIVLAFSGVFSGSSRHPATVTATAQLTRPTTATTSPSTAPATTPARPLAPAIPKPTVTLQPGDQGAQVKLLQQVLRRLGYLNGPADGVYGQSTRDALTALQRVSLLPADGVLGPQTLHALDQLIKQARRGSP